MKIIIGTTGDGLLDWLASFKPTTFVNANEIMAEESEIPTALNVVKGATKEVLERKHVGNQAWLAEDKLTELRELTSFNAAGLRKGKITLQDFPQVSSLYNEWKGLTAKVKRQEGDDKERAVNKANLKQIEKEIKEVDLN